MIQAKASLLTSLKFSAIGLIVGLSAGVAGCEDLDGTNDVRIALSCSNYCEKANECDSDVDIDECEADCEATANDCQADEQEQALDDLDDCAQDSCDEFAACTVGAGLQCSLGL